MNIYKYGSLGDIVQMVNVCGGKQEPPVFHVNEKFVYLLSALYPNVRFIGYSKFVIFLLHILFSTDKAYVAHSHRLLDFIMIVRFGKLRILSESKLLAKIFKDDVTLYDDTSSRFTKLTKLVGYFPIVHQGNNESRSNNIIGIIPFGGNATMDAKGRQLSMELLSSIINLCQLYPDILFKCIGVPPENNNDFIKLPNNVQILSNNLHPDEILDFFEEADAFVATDVGLSHIAINSGKPVFYFQGATNFNLIYSPKHFPNVVLCKSSATCSPCYFEKGSRKLNPQMCPTHHCMAPDFHKRFEDNLRIWLEKLP